MCASFLALPHVRARYPSFSPRTGPIIHCFIFLTCIFLRELALLRMGSILQFTTGNNFEERERNCTLNWGKQDEHTREHGTFAPQPQEQRTHTHARARTHVPGQWRA